MGDLVQQLPSALAFLFDLAFFVSPLQGHDLTFLPESISSSPLFVPYEALVLTVRAVAGMLLGIHVRRHHPIRFFVTVAAAFCGILFAYSHIPSAVFLAIRLLWMGFGTLVASFQFTRVFKQHHFFGSLAGLVCLFIGFFLVSLHVSNDVKIAWLCISAFPIGFIVGYVISHKVPDEGSEGANSSRYI